MLIQRTLLCLLLLSCTGCLSTAVDVIGHTTSAAVSITTSAVSAVLP